MELEELARQIQRTWDNGARRGTQLPFELDVSIGLEQRSVTDRYDWYGLQRGSRNSVVIQYTLSGWGMYTDAQGRSIRLDPGMFFVAIVPSDHRYYLPRDSPTWRFFYVVLLHPWTHARMARTLEQGHAVQVAAPDAPFTAALVRMWSAVRRGEVADDIAMERLLMDLALEHDRLVRAQRDGVDERARELAAVRDYLSAHPGQTVEVSDLAAEAGLSRSAYAHRFSARTGLSPARYIAQLRLDHVRRSLLEGDETLAALAVRTGFADANHLCKVFRRHYHQSPGQYRRQMGG
jgi:AraC-like DNA-binding protein